jgi:polysaccharide export outer membrane protein
MNADRKLLLFWLLGLLCAVTMLPTAVIAEPDQARTTVEIRISLPEGVDAKVAVSPSGNRVILELPRGSVFPLDFAASSGGLLRGGEVVPLDGDRVRLELELARGLLGRIEFETDAVVLHFQSRFELSSTAAPPDDQYLLGPHDKILITVHNHPELTSHLTVTREGLITAPLVGDVTASGLSPPQLASTLSELLGRDYLVSPKVDVEIESYRSQWVMVSGAVKLAGRVPLTGGTRLKEVLSEAGGFSESAGERIIISREREGSEERIYVERLAFGSGDSNPVLQDGDIIDVISAAYCYVHGEVRNPTRVRVERGMTLLKALTIAGGLTEWADRKSVTILPGDESQPANGQAAEGAVTPPERVYNVKRIQSGKDEDPRLRGGEIVVVKRRFF